jgi:hypothetical protein
MGSFVRMLAVTKYALEKPFPVSRFLLAATRYLLPVFFVADLTGNGLRVTGNRHRVTGNVPQKRLNAKLSVR